MIKEKESKYNLKEISKKQTDEIERKNGIGRDLRTEISSMAGQLHEKKDDLRRIQEQNKQLDKKISENHNLIIHLNGEYQKYKKQAKKSKPAFDAFTADPGLLEEIEQLQARYKELLEQKESARQTFEEEKSSYDRNYRELTKKNQATAKELDERNKEIIFNSIKLKKLQKEKPEDFLNEMARLERFRNKLKN